VDLTGLRHVVLDTSACIYHLQSPAADPRAAVVRPLAERAEQGRLTLAVSAVTVTELLTAPIRRGDQAAEATVRVFLDLLCTVVALDHALAVRAARVRAATGLRTPDAVICATALHLGTDAVVGNDARWRRVSGLPYRHIDDLAGS
jgi:predicted nucleic acid-binding protein